VSTAAHQLHELTEDEFEEIYVSVGNPRDDGFYWDLQDDPVDQIDPKKVWTAIEGDDDVHFYLLPGIHRINRFAYVVTENPWPHEHIEVTLDDYRENEEH